MKREELTELQRMTPLELYDACDELHREFAEMAIADAERSIDWLQSLCLITVIYMITIVMATKSVSIAVFGVVMIGVSWTVTYHYTRKSQKLIARMQENLQGGTDAGHSEDVR